MRFFGSKGIGLGLMIGVALSVASCGRANLMPSADFLEKKGTIALVWASKHQNATFTREGSQGLLDIALSEMTAGSLPAKMQETKVEPIMDSEYLNKYAPQFVKHGFKANMVQMPLDKSNLREVPKKSDKSFWLDFKDYKVKYGVDYVLFVDLNAFGARQNFFGPVALGAPRGETKVDLFLVDTSDNNIVGEYHVSKTIEPKGKWDNPPDYPEMMEAVKGTLRTSLEDAFFGFFKWEKTL